MTGSIKIVVPGDPVPWGRVQARIIQPKGWVNGRPKKPFISFYTGAETRDYESKVKDAAIRVMDGAEPIDQACELHAKVYLAIPTSWSQKNTGKALAGEIRPAVRPDADNYLKSVLDALNKVVYVDDGRIVAISCEKHYSTEPRMEIEIRMPEPTMRLL